MIVREATINDCESIMNVLNSCILEKGSMSSLVRPIESVEEEEEFFCSLKERERLLVAQEDKVVGFGCLYLYSMIETIGHVGGVGTFVIPPMRHRGVGKALSDALVIKARELGYEKLLAEVRKQNKTGLKFYESCGFKKIAELKNHIKIEDQYDDIILMENSI